MINWGSQPVGAVLPFPFQTFGAAAGESITLTGLAVTDIEVYSGVSMTQRASDNGYTLLDTDGIDLDTTTGIHGFSINTGDDTTAGFFVAGGFYWVVVKSVTVDSQTVNFIAGYFSLRPAEASPGVPPIDIAYVNGSAFNAAVGQFPANVVEFGGNPAVAAAGIPSVNVAQISGDSAAADALESYTDGTTKMPVNVEEVNNTQIQGVGTAGNKWRPA